MPKHQRVRRDIALPAAKLGASLGDTARPRRHERIPRDARGLPGILELEDLQDLARPAFTGVRDRREPARQFDRRTVGRRRIRDDVIGVHGGIVDVDRRREVGEAVVPGAQDVDARAVRTPERDAVAASCIAAHGVDRSAAVTGDAMQDDPGIRERRRFAAAAQHPSANAYLGSLRGKHREGTEPPPPEQQGATA